MELKKILIFDESGFSRVCSSLLENDGFGTETISEIDKLDSTLNNNEFGLVITSYPFGEFFIHRLLRNKIPTILLFDHINKGLINAIEKAENFFCMVKPLDYQKFRSFVKKLMRGEVTLQGGYNIV